MNILTIDTATEGCSAAVFADGVISAKFEELDRGHAERVLQMVDEVLEAARLRLTDLHAIGFGRGPGAFTGVRLGASVAQGLAFGAALPLVPVSNLRALAQRALDRWPDAHRVLACADARMREVYWGEFARDANGLATAASAERVDPPSAVCSATAAEVWIGRGFRAYPELVARLGIAADRLEDSALPRAGEIARLAAIDFGSGLAVAPEHALPSYLRNDVARPQTSR